MVHQCLTVAGKGERLPEVLADDSHLHADSQTLMQLLLPHRGRPHEAGVGGAVAVRECRAQTAAKHTNFDSGGMKLGNVFN